MSAIHKIKESRPRRKSSGNNRRKIKSEAARVKVCHFIAPGHLQAEIEAREGERIADVLLRAGWVQENPKGKTKYTFRLPSIVCINGEPVLQRNWRRRRIKASDNVAFLSRPQGGASGKQIAGIVAAVGLAIFAPWAAGGLSAAYFGGSMLATGLITGAIGIAGELYLSALPTIMKARGRHG